MKYFLFILGCQYNEWDGARLRYFLDANKLVEAPEKEADLIVVVACSVRQTAIDRIFGRLKNWRDKKARKLKRYGACLIREGWWELLLVGLAQ